MNKNVLILCATWIFFTGWIDTLKAGVVDSGYCNDYETCLWSLDSDGTLTVSAKEGATDVVMKDYNCAGYNCSEVSGNRPWENYLQQIETITVGDNITTIGKNAFQDAHNLKTVTGMNDVTTINNDIFVYADSLTNFTVPDSVTSVANDVFYGAKNLSEIIIPDSWGDDENNFALASGLFNKSCFATVNRSDDCPAPSDMKIVCKGETSKCEAALAKFKTGGTACASDSSYCLNDAVKIASAGFAECASTNYFWDGAKCIREPDVTKRKCCTSCKDMGGWCNRIYYTPAEAAAVLHDDNTNSVTITFRK